MKHIKLYLAVCLLALNFTSCDDTYHSSIPDFPVFLELNLATAPYNTFANSTLKYFIFKNGITVRDRVGYGGIFLCTGYENGTIYAFDLACPYEADNKILVRPFEQNGDFIGKVICDKCGSVFEVGFGIGNPSAGPAKETLRRYKVNQNGYSLIITR